MKLALIIIGLFLIFSCIASVLVICKVIKEQKEMSKPNPEKMKQAEEFERKVKESKERMEKFKEEHFPN